MLAVICRNIVEVLQRCLFNLRYRYLQNRNMNNLNQIEGANNTPNPAIPEVPKPPNTKQEAPKPPTPVPDDPKPTPITETPNPPISEVPKLPTPISKPWKPANDQPVSPKCNTSNRGSAATATLANATPKAKTPIARGNIATLTNGTPKSLENIPISRTGITPISGLLENMAIGVNENTSDGHNTRDFYSLYDVKEVLGRGMSSVVRRCVEKSTNTEFAVKILDVSTEKMTQAEADDLRNCTKREIKMLRAVAGHENIIALHDFYETSTFLFIIFELARGGELFDYLTEVVTLSEKKTRHIMRQLIDSVRVMHDNRIVHRDLKPENILMVGDDRIKLTDFGFAYQLEKDEKLRELCGTPGYLAPEVLAASMHEESCGYDVQVDMWACGVIMYTLLCGYAPFFHRKQIYMLRAISEGKFEFRSPEWDEVGNSAKDLISRLLVVDPETRLTVRQALQHPFLALHALPAEEKKFNARRRFRMAIIQVRMIVRLLRILKVPMLIPVCSARQNPYAARKVRRQVDAVAFRIYGHWVKKGREQYRDALFANAPLASVVNANPAYRSMSSM